jgi:hypothetical protein
LFLESFMEIMICSFISLQDNVIVTSSDKVSKSFVYVCLPLGFSLVYIGGYFVSFGSNILVKSSKLLTKNRKYEEKRFP